MDNQTQREPLPPPQVPKRPPVISWEALAPKVRMLADAAGYTERIVQVVADDDPAVRRAIVRGSFHERLLGLVVPKPGQMVLSSADVPRLHLRISRVSAFVDVVLLAEDEKRELGHWLIRGARWSPLP